MFLFLSVFSKFSLLFASFRVVVFTMQSKHMLDEDILREDPSYFELKLWHGTRSGGLVVHTVMRLVFTEDAEGFFRLPYDVVHSVLGLIHLCFDARKPPTGRFFKYLEGVMPRELSNPSGLCYDHREGIVAIAEHGNERVILWYIDQRKPAALVRQGPPFDSIDSIVMIDEQTLAVSDTKADCVFVVEMKKDGRILRKIGKYGEGLGQFRHPMGIAVTEDSQLVVCDS